MWVFIRHLISLLIVSKCVLLSPVVPQEYTMHQAVSEKCPKLSPPISTHLKQLMDTYACTDWLNINKTAKLTTYTANEVRCLILYEGLTAYCKQPDAFSSPYVQSNDKIAPFCDKFENIIRSMNVEHDFVKTIDSTSCQRICYDIYAEKILDMCGNAYFFALHSLTAPEEGQKQAPEGANQQPSKPEHTESNLGENTNNNNKNPNLISDVNSGKGEVVAVIPGAKASNEIDQATIEQNLDSSQKNTDNTKKILDDTKKNLDDTKKTIDNTKKEVDDNVKNVGSTENKSKAPSGDVGTNQSTKAEVSANQAKNSLVEGAIIENNVKSNDNNNKDNNQNDNKQSNNNTGNSQNKNDDNQNNNNSQNNIENKGNSQPAPPIAPKSEPKPDLANSDKTNTPEKLSPNKNTDQGVVQTNPERQPDDEAYQKNYDDDETDKDLMVEMEKPKAAEPEKADNNHAALPIDDESVVSEKLQQSMKMDGDSSFFSYFMVTCLFVVAGYVGYHNRQKIFALVLEGRRGRRQNRSRRPNSANYRKLDSNLEEAISSSCSKNTSNVIY